MPSDKEKFVKEILDLVKARKGISSDVRDNLMTAIIEGNISELEKVNGITVEAERSDIKLLILDWTTWKYDHPEDGRLPRSIQFRIHNLMVGENHDMG